MVAKYFVTKEEADQYVKALRGAAARALPAVRSAALVYFIQSETGLIKIGHAVDVHARLRSLQIGSPARLTLLATIAGGVAMEARLHRRFGADRMHGEWFKPSPQLLAYIETKATPAPR